MIGQYDITDPRTLTCEFCDQEAAGRVRVDLYGGALMVCMACYELLRNSQSKPYSRVMDKFSMKSRGHHVSIKQARFTTYMARIGR
jgi:ribosome-binding protein aMBF1 (putative translation factor)